MGNILPDKNTGDENAAFRSHGDALDPRPSHGSPLSPMATALTDGTQAGSLIPRPDGEESTSLRALAIIATRLGLDVSVDQLRRRFALPPGEPDTATLIAVAKEIGLEARSLRMSFQELPQVGRALPAILRARNGGALILEEARTDPA